MQPIRPVYFFLEEDAMLADDLDEPDELDMHFNQLQRIKPPPSLISRILSSIASLSQPVPTRWDDLDGPVVRNEGREPS